MAGVKGLAQAEEMRVDKWKSIVKWISNVLKAGCCLQLWRERRNPGDEIVIIIKDRMNVYW